MVLRAWIRKLFGRPVRPIRQSPPRVRLSVEALEDRVTPSTFTVVNTGDSGAGSLRDAIAVAQTGANLGVPDPILFNDGTLPGTHFYDGALHTITLTSGPLPLTHTATTMISGPGAGLLSIS